jgi:hypothetical protein
MKFKIVDAWTLVVLIANFSHILATLIMVFPYTLQTNSHATGDLIFGIGTFLIWVSMTMYL